MSRDGTEMRMEMGWDGDGAVQQRWAGMQGAPLSLQDAPERAAEGGEEGEGGDVVGLLEGPVIGGEGARQRHLAQRDGEVGEPEEHEEVEELQHRQRAVERRLAAIERKEALGAGALRRRAARVERLRAEGGGQPRRHRRHQNATNQQ